MTIAVNKEILRGKKERTKEEKKKVGTWNWVSFLFPFPGSRRITLYSDGRRERDEGEERGKSQLPSFLSIFTFSHRQRTRTLAPLDRQGPARAPPVVVPPV